jgi:hypothetical protein
MSIPCYFQRPADNLYWVAIFSFQITAASGSLSGVLAQCHVLDSVAFWAVGYLLPKL